MDLKHIIAQQRRRAYGPSFDIAFSTDKSNVSRTGPNPVFSRASSGMFVNENGRIVGKTRSTTSLNPARVPVGGVAVFEVPSGSVVGWLNNSVVVVMEDTDGDDQIGAQRHVTGTLIHKTDTAITLLVTSKVGTTALSSWSVSYRGLRIDHDPITGLCLGTLIEISKTNIVEMSESFDNTAVWTQVRLVSQPVANTDIAPDGSLTAEKFIPSSTLDNHRIDDPTIGIVSGSSYTVSAFAKAAGYTGFGIHVGSSPIPSATFSLTGSGSVTSTATGWTARIYPYRDGWYRCCATFTATTANRLYLFVGQTGTTFTYAGDTTSGIVVWGAQCELSRESSYIPNYRLGSVVRAQDLYTITGSNFTNMYNQNKGTVVCSHRITSIHTNHGVYGITAPARPDAGITMVMTTATLAANSVYSSPPNYTSQASFTSTVVDRILVKSAIALQTDDFACSINGSIATDNLGELNPIMDRFVIGATGNISGPQVGLNTFSSLRYYPERLTNAQLQTLTTTTSETITYNGVAITYNGVGLLETS